MISLSHQNSLRQEKERHQSINLIDLFRCDPDRVHKLTFMLDDLRVDLSKHHLDDRSLAALLSWADAVDLKQEICCLFNGGKINATENRAVMHMALRAHADDHYQVDDLDVMPQVKAVQTRCYDFARKIREKKWLGWTGKPVDTIVNIGIGGSDLGPKLVVNALRAYADPSINIHFVSRLDNLHIHEVLQQCDPETTLFVVVSKTFTTLETIHNACAARQWCIEHLDDQAVSRHFVAVSTNTVAVTQFGIDPAHMFPFWDWVGGRYSVWSAVGLTAMVALGETQFNSFLEGARAVDTHFRETPFERNIPVIMGLLGAWYRRFWDVPAQAVLSYDEHLGLLVSYLQQLDMESNGKAVDKNGKDQTEPTGPIVFGGLGIDGQHAYYQWLHQGVDMVPADFIAPAKATIGTQKDHRLLLSNCLAQAQALMLGKNEAQVHAELQQCGLSEDDITKLLPFKVFKGNRPSTMIFYPVLSPSILGMLLALYEHKVFVQGVLWNIYSFDQWGVELGKVLAKKLVPALIDGVDVTYDDPSTESLVTYIRAQ